MDLDTGVSTTTTEMVGSSTVSTTVSEPTLWQGYEITAIVILFFAAGMHVGICFFKKSKS